ncbi:ABC transporter membrane-spanning protein [Mycolicibacterium pulveris]|uniref:ABC transporter membrane-spanning protein n=2 Tax=Mycolicibacterium pulveris TaxID=36813 RepID=A0A7I7UDF7_MYCPV|nr:ABC transporter membrane-spanning protein [Mycolicibacterium pulveris]
MSFLVAAQYKSTFQDALSPEALRALAENPAIRVLFGTPMALDDAGGFTVWRTGTPLLVVAGVWIMLAAVRITRGEEDTGRWDFLLSGTLRVSDTLRSCALALACSALVISLGVWAALLAAGTAAWGATLYAAGFLGVTLTFAAAGFVAAQLMPNRPRAVGTAVGFLGASLLLRMIADAATTLAGLAWISPLGLIARTAPFADNRVAPLAVLACYPVALGTAAMAISASRDVGSGLLTVSDSRAPRPRLLGSVMGFAVRRSLRSTLGWAAAIATYFVVFGATIASILEFFEQNPRFADLAAAAGFAGLNSAEGFCAALLALCALATGMYADTRIGAFVDDEQARRATLLFASPVSRAGLLSTEIAVVAFGVLALHVTAAAGITVGAAVTGAPLSFSDAVAGALNTAPIAALALGAAALAAGWSPSAVTAVGAVPVVGGFLLNVVAESMHAPGWVGNLSPFVHVQPVPLLGPDWAALGVLVSISAVLAAIEMAGYRRRDLTS